MTNTSDALPDEPGPSKSGGNRKQIIAGGLTLLILIVVFGVVFPQFADYSEAWTAIQAMSTAALVALVAAMVINIVIYVGPYPAALPGLAFWPAFVVRQTSFMISNTIPAGGAFGLGVQYSMLGSYEFGPAATSATIGITSVWNMFVTLTLPVLAVIGLILTSEPATAAIIVAGIGVVAVGVMVVGFALVLRSESTARRMGELGGRIVGWFLGLIHRDADLALGDALVSFRSSTVDVISVRWAPITAANVLQQLVQFSILYLAVVGIQGGTSDPITLVEAFAAFAFARLATFIPIPPGGLGTVDAAMTALLTAFGMASSDALAAVLVWRALSYFPQVFLGIGTFVYWRRRQSRRTLQAG